MAFRTCSQNAASAEHMHDCDEYMLVVQGCYTLMINGKRIRLDAGEEYFIPRGLIHAGEVIAGTRTIHAFGGTVANPIATMTQEHVAAGTLIAEIRRLSGNFTAPEDACRTFHAFYDGLREFEQERHQHIHLGNSRYFPRAIELELPANRIEN